MAQDVAVNTLTRGVDGLENALSGYRKDVDAYLTDAFTRHPTVSKIRTLTTLIGDRTKGAEPARRGLLDVLLPPVALPDFGKLVKDLPVPEVPPLTWKAVQAEAARPPGPGSGGLPLSGVPRMMLGLQARAAVAAMADRPSVLADQQAPLRAALAANRAALGRLATGILDLLRTALVPALWDRYAPLAEPVVRRFVDLVYAEAGPAERPLPVLRPDDPVPVRPVITRLRLHLPGADEAQARAWRDTLLARLQGQSYVVAPATWGR